LDIECWIPIYNEALFIGLLELLSTVNPEKLPKDLAGNSSKFGSKNNLKILNSIEVRGLML
jgi:hypothetical protein